MNIIPRREIDECLARENARLVREDERSYVRLWYDPEPRLEVYSWADGADKGMVTFYLTIADEVADFLGLDGYGFYAWCMGDDGNPTLCCFDDEYSRHLWLKQK